MDSKLRALIIDDSSDDAFLIAHELQCGGFDLYWKHVETNLDLKAHLKTNSWDIALSDYSMPQFNALDAIATIRDISPGLPCIVISGTIGEETAVAAMHAGAQDFFVKGRLTRLCAAVRRQLVEVENLKLRKKAESDLRESEERRWKEREEALQKEIEARQKMERLYQEAQDANRIKENFLHNLSHELRTPMNAISGFTEILVDGICSLEEYPQIFAAIQRNVCAENKIINEILDFSRITTGQLTIESAPVNLEELAKASLKMFQLVANSKGITVTLETKPFTGVVLGDASRLGEVISHLLSNALKFTPNGGRIHMSLYQHESEVALQIKDTGEGITPDFLPHVFEYFRQADGSLTRRHGGLGLGLAIAQRLVELHGGDIKAQSDGAGTGSTFTFHLPLRTPKVSDRHLSPEQALSI